MRRRTISSFAVADDPAIGEVNTTPLIDVMLVLVILCVISIPMMTHKVSLRLPSGIPEGMVQPQVYRIALGAAGKLSWNGIPTSLGELPRQLEAVERNPDSRLEISASGAARYEAFDQMLVVVKRSGVDRIDFVGHGAFARDLDR